MSGAGASTSDSVAGLAAAARLDARFESLSAASEKRPSPRAGPTPPGSWRSTGRPRWYRSTSTEQWITPANAPQFLEEAKGLMRRVDLISLDIDGNDYWVAEALDTTNARHFTDFSLQHESGSSAKLDGDLPRKIDMMNPMYFIAQKNPGAAGNYWIRYGTSDANTSLPVIANLAAGMATMARTSTA
jgi:hypothetical protein